jgi:hypothetical protein
MTQEREGRITVRCLFGCHDAAPDDDGFLIDDGTTPPDASRCFAVAVPSHGAARARELLASGAPRVLLGEAALNDSALVERLAHEFGSQRIGLYVPVKRMQVSWTMDSVSNADFRFMTPSTCEPCWEILKADGARTGTIASWWIGEMLRRGAALALVRADVGDDTDLNLCADLVERYGERLWIGPLEDGQPPLGEWVEYGKARQLAIPADIYLNSDTVLAWRSLADNERRTGATA